MALERLGPYKLISVLGRGGMGTVYKSEHVESKDSFAVKVLAPAYSNDPHFRSRFESEIKALYKLDHENIVRLISYGQDDSNLFFAMELVDGKSLFQLQRSGKRFYWREVLKIARDVAQGLRHAHDRGIIHRDLKPGNLLQAPSGVVKITDFGIAKSFGSSHITGTNVVGTVDFMSPEQAKGQPVTFRSDLYSLGTVMFTLLSGSPPFTGNSVEESLRNLTTVPAPKVTHRAPDVPDAIEGLISNLLQKDPNKRIQTAQALLHQLTKIATELRDYSEAKTAEKSPIIPSDLTLVSDKKHLTNAGVAISGKAKTIENRIESRKPKTSSSNKKRNVTVNQNVNEEATHESEIKLVDEIDRRDYFNTVAEVKKRKPDVVPVSHQSATLKGILSAALPLLAVIGLVWFGVSQVNKPPTAEALLTQIEASKNSPQLRLGEIEDFIARFPDHEKITWVKTQRDVGLGNQVYNRLKAISKTTGKLSQLEQRFLQIVELKEADAPTAHDQLSAFVALHNGDETLEPRATEAVGAARSYLPAFALAADETKRITREKINNAFLRAESANTKEDAFKLYESIVKLYSDVPWVKDLTEKAAAELKRLEKD